MILITSNGVYQDTCVIAWSERHYKRYKYNTENVEKKSGVYTNTIEIPGYLINSGKYYLNIELINGETAYENFQKK